MQNKIMYVMELKIVGITFTGTIYRFKLHEISYPVDKSRKVGGAWEVDFKEE